MELKTARLTLLIDPNKKAAFERLCAQRDLTASQVVRQMIRDYLLAHGVSYTPSGEDTPDGEPAPSVNKVPADTAAAPAPRGRRPTPPAAAAKTRRRPRA
jgi:hypothetical protein